MCRDRSLSQFKHVNRSKWTWINTRKCLFSTVEHHFSSLCPPKLICSSVWFVVKARNDTAAATGHAQLHIIRANNIYILLNIVKYKWFLKKYRAPYFHHFRECRSEGLFAVKDLSKFNEGEETWSDARWAALKTEERTCAYTVPDWGQVHGFLSTEW